MVDFQEHFLEYWNSKVSTLIDFKVDTTSLSILHEGISSILGYDYNLHHDLNINIENRPAICLNGSIEHISNQSKFENINPENGDWISTRNISSQVKALMTDDLKKEYYKLQIEAIVDRHLLRGSVNDFWIKILLIRTQGFDSRALSLNESLFKIGFQKIKSWHQFGSYFHLSSELNQKVKQLEAEMYDALILKQRTQISVDDFTNSFIVDQVIFPECLSLVHHRYSGIEYPLCGFAYDLWDRNGKLNLKTASLVKDVKYHMDQHICDLNLWYKYLETFSRGENTIREMLGIPKIGEGWISETILYYSLCQEFPNELIVQHGKPKWLGRQHLDIYFPKRNIAIEYHGEQHFAPVEYFGGEIAFARNQARDARKRKLCEDNGCILLEVDKAFELPSLITRITSLLN